MSKAERTFLPAAGRDWLLPLYDPITRLLGVDTARRDLLEQAALQPGYRVLDVGCGTGTLAILLKQLHPSIEVIGIDPDPRALDRARRKAERAGVSLRFDRGFADVLPYPDHAFDRVFSSMMFHHLEARGKQGMLLEIRRVLRRGGRLELLDFADTPAHKHGGLRRLIHSHRQLRDNSDGRILELMAGAGLVNPRTVAERTGIFGRVASFSAEGLG